MARCRRYLTWEDVIKNEPISNDEEQAVLTAENSGLKFGPVNNTHIGEVIELLDDDIEDALNEGIRNDIMIKREEQEPKNS